MNRVNRQSFIHFVCDHDEEIFTSINKIENPIFVDILGFKKDFAGRTVLNYEINKTSRSSTYLEMTEMIENDILNDHVVVIITKIKSPVDLEYIKLIAIIIEMCENIFITERFSEHIKAFIFVDQEFLTSDA